MGSGFVWFLNILTLHCALTFHSRSNLSHVCSNLSHISSPAAAAVFITNQWSTVIFLLLPTLTNTHVRTEWVPHGTICCSDLLESAAHASHGRSSRGTWHDCVHPGVCAVSPLPTHISIQHQHPNIQFHLLQCLNSSPLVLRT